MLPKTLIHYLKKIKKEEFKSLEYFLKHGSNKSANQALLLLAYLKEYPNFDEAYRLDINYIAKGLSGKIEKVTALKIYNTAQHLIEKIESWLVYQFLEAEKNQPLQQFLLTKALGERQLYDEYILGIEKCIEKSNTFKNAIIDKEYLRFNLYFQQYCHPLTNHKNVANTILDNAETELDYFYLIQKLRIGIEKYYERPTLLKIKIDIPDEWKNILNKAEQSKHWLVQMYFTICLIYQSDQKEEAQINQLHDLYKVNLTNLSDFDARSFMTTLVNLYNYLLKRFNHKKYFSIILDLYDDGLNKGFSTPNQQITYTTFRNIALLQSKNQDITRYQNFVSKYSPMLVEENRQNAILLADAYFACYACDFDLCLEKIKEINRRNAHDVIILYSAYCLEIIAIFELLLMKKDVLDNLDNKINAFSVFISRDGADKKAVYNNFLLAVKSLHRIYFEHKIKETEVMYFKVLIAHQQPIVQRDWLEDFLLRIMKKKGH